MSDWAMRVDSKTSRESSKARGLVKVDVSRRERIVEVGNQRGRELACYCPVGAEIWFTGAGTRRSFSPPGPGFGARLIDLPVTFC